MRRRSRILRGDDERRQISAAAREQGRGFLLIDDVVRAVPVEEEEEAFEGTGMLMFVCKIA